MKVTFVETEASRGTTLFISVDTIKSLLIIWSDNFNKSMLWYEKLQEIDSSYFHSRIFIN